MTTPQPRSTDGTTGSSFAPAPPPGCPAHTAIHPDAMPMSGPRFQNDRSQLYRDVRKQHGAVAPIVLPGDVPGWLVLGYRELHNITNNPGLFTRDSSFWNMWDSIPDDWPMLPMVGKQQSILYTTGDRHQQRSALLSESLDKVDPFELRNHAEHYADVLIDSFCGRGEADLISEYASVLPALVLANIFGFSDFEGARLLPCLDSLTNGDAAAHDSRETVIAALGELMRDRQTQPGADVASYMLQHELADDFSFQEKVEDMMVNLLGGHQPSADWIGNTLRLMLTDDRFAASLSGGRHSVGEAMNEVLWEDTPTQSIAGRWATRDTQLGGKRIRSGDLLILCFGGANTDPQVRPDQFTLTGGNNAFLSFGHGDHRCPYPAQEIAEAIARTGIEVLLDRLPDVDLAVAAQALVWRPSPWMRGLEALPVHFTPSSSLGGTR